MKIAIKFTNGIGATTNTFAAFDDTCEVTVTGLTEPAFYVILSKCGGVALCNPALAVDGVATLNLNTDRIRSLFADGRCDSKGLVTVYSTTNHVLGVAAVLISYAADPITGTVVVGETYITSLVAGANITIDDTDPENPIISATGDLGVTSVNGDTGPEVVLDADDIAASATRLWLTTAQAAIIAATSGTNTGDQTLPTKTSDLTNDSVLGDITEGANITIDRTDPRNPTISAVGGSGSTDLSEGTATETTVDVNSSSGNNATLQPASTLRAGVMSKAKFDEVEENNAHRSDVTTNPHNVTLAHEALTNLLGGAANDHYHLTGTQHTDLTDGGETTLHTHSETDPLSLHLDQTTPQSIINGQPIQGTLTASELVATDASKKLQSLAVSTYPSLAELAYVKGVTSAIQAQLNAGLVEVVSSLPGSPTSEKIYLLNNEDFSANAAMGIYAYWNSGWVCLSSWGDVDLGNISGAVTMTLIPGTSYIATQTGAVTSWAVTFTNKGIVEIDITGAYALATPTTSVTTVLFKDSTAWDDASAAFKTVTLEKKGSYLKIIAAAIVAV